MKIYPYSPGASLSGLGCRGCYRRSGSTYCITAQSEVEEAWRRTTGTTYLSGILRAAQDADRDSIKESNAISAVACEC